jgi:hypothetical protein
MTDKAEDWGRKTKDLERDVGRLNGINSALAERNEKLIEENRQLRDALSAGNLFRKASEIKSKDVVITADKFGQLFVTLRNNMTNGTEAIVCQLNDDGTKVTSIIPQSKTKEVIAKA